MYTSNNSLKPRSIGLPSPVCNGQADGPSRELLFGSPQRLPNTTAILWNCLSGAVSRSGQASVLNGYPEELPGREFGVRYGKGNTRTRSETPCIQPYAVLASIILDSSDLPALEPLHIQGPSSAGLSERCQAPGVRPSAPYFGRQTALCLESCNHLSERRLSLRTAAIRLGVIPHHSF